MEQVVIRKRKERMKMHGKMARENRCAMASATMKSKKSMNACISRSKEARKNTCELLALIKKEMRKSLPKGTSSRLHV